MPIAQPKMHDLQELLTPESLTLSAFGIGTLWLVVRKLWMNAVVENVKVSESSATKTIIDTLRAEVERLSAINTNLSGALNELRIENANLRNDVNRLNSALEEMQIKLQIVSIRGRAGERIDGEERRNLDQSQKKSWKL